MSDPDIMIVKFAVMVAGSFILYVFLLRRLADLVQPYRLRMAEVGEGLLCERPPEPIAEQIRFYLDNAFSGWFMLVAAIALPAIILCILVMCLTRAGRKKLSQEQNINEKLVALFLISTFAANPLFGIVLGAELLTFGLLAILIAGPTALMAALAQVLSAGARARGAHHGTVHLTP
jgi:tetrahydromethanopterin S-methyltransferase subunit B